jgi:hypothetical protein
MTTFYELAKQKLATRPALNDYEFQQSIKTLTQWIEENYKPEEPYMLLCREQNDYTIFTYNSGNPVHFAEELMYLAKSRGAIVAAEKSTEECSDKYEFWVRFGNEIYLYYLFPCSDFFVNC